MSKDFRHYRALEAELSKLVDADTKEALLAGMDFVSSSSQPEVKAAWAREMMQRLDRMLDPDTRVLIREGCACVLTNEKSIYARTFRKLRKRYPDEDEYLDEVVKYLNATTPLRRCGEVRREGDWIYSVIARGKCDCPVLKDGLKEPISATWCQCSKGSLLSVYRYVFPEKRCEMQIVETIATGGEECRFATTYW